MCNYLNWLKIKHRVAEKVNMELNIEFELLHRLESQQHIRSGEPKSPVRFTLLMSISALPQ
jgi:hypothetical protein